MNTHRDPIMRHRLGAWLRQHAAIALVVSAFLALGMTYSVVTPVFETPDEPWHYRYIKYLANGQGLPPLSVATDEWAQGEAHQPPLYYAIGALLTRSIDASPELDPYERNPFAALGLPHAPGNKNAVLHLDTSPAPEAVRAVRVLRGFSVCCAALVVWLAYAIALEVCAERRVLAVGTAVLVAFTPQFLFISAAVNNDTLVTLWSTLMLYLALRVSNDKVHPYRTPLWMGVTAGLAGLTKLSGLATLLLVPVAYGLRFSRLPARRVWPDLLRPLLIVGGMALAVGGWWYGRNALQYRDPLGMQAMRAAFSMRQEPLTVGDTLRVLLESWVSYWGVFGWMNVLADEAFYTLTRLLTALGVAGLILLAAQIRWQRKVVARERWHAVAILALWIIVVLAALARWVQLITGPQGRLLFPAIASISFFLFLGLSAWLAHRYTYVMVLGLIIVLLPAAAWIPFYTIAPAYQKPVRMELEDVPPRIRDLGISFGDDLFLLGYELEQSSVRAGEELSLHLYWLARKQMHEDYVVFVRVLGRDGERVGGVDSYPGGGTYPTRLWLPGEVVRDTYAIAIARDAVAPTAGVVRVGVYRQPGVQNVQATDTRGHDLGHNPEITRVRIGPMRAARYEPQYPLQVNLDQRVMLTGYDLFLQPPLEGDHLEVTLYWRALMRMSQEYTVFIHLVDELGQMVAQVDQQPLAGQYPTRFWEIGEHIKDPHVLALPDNLSDGDYMLHVGLYLLDTGERLPIAETDPPDTYVVLGPIRIEGR